MLTQASVVGVLAIGMTFVIATAGHRLVRRLDGRGGRRLRGILIGTDGTSSLIFILGAIAFATFLGTVNATPSPTRIVPFIATLAMFSIARGLALLLNDKLPVSLLDLNGGSFGDPRAFSLLWFGNGRIFGIPVSVYVFVAITIAGWIVLNRTRYGRYVVAVGGNREAHASPASPSGESSSASTSCPGCRRGGDRALLRAARERLAGERKPLRARRDRGGRDRRDESGRHGRRSSARFSASSRSRSSSAS